MLGMALDAGGHLTHGFRPNISGKLFEQASYGTDPETGLLDYDAIAAQAREFRPLVLLAGYSAYPRTPNFRVLREIADEVGATLMVDMAHFAGLVAGGVLTGDLNPVPHAEVVTSTTHKSLRGPRGGFVLCTGEYAPFVDKGCPMVLGGPLPHVMAAKAVAFAEARQPSFAAYASAVVANAQALAEGLLRRGARLVTGGTSNHIVLLGRGRELRADRPPGRVGAARRGGGDQPQQRPARPQRRLVHLRHPAGHPGADHARVRPGRDGRDRRHHHRRAARHRSRRRGAPRPSTPSTTGSRRSPASAAPSCSAATRSTRASSCDGLDGYMG